MPKRFPYTGTIVARCLCNDGDHEVAVSVVLPISLWKQVTDWINDIYHVAGEARPEIPLEARITEFLDLQTQMWISETRPRPRPGGFDDDLDDDVPF